jgi:hypothetical protein
MFYKKDFQTVRETWTNWWNAEDGVQPITINFSPKSGITNSSLPNPVFDGDNVDILIEQLYAWVESHELSENYVPGCVVNFGADHFAALLGADLQVNKESRTTWIKPNVSSWSQTDIRVRWDSGIGAKTIEYIHHLREACDGKILISATHLQGGLDCLAALRDPYALLYDLIDDPQGVTKALKDVDRAFSEAVRVFKSEFDTDRWGSVNRHGLYCPGFAGLLQCDFSCMIDSEMFKRFALPSLAHEAQAVDYAEYHLDGESAIHHLEDICSIDEIKIIQWQPGITGLDKDWKNLHSKIDNLGRGQYFFHPDKAMRQWVADELNCRNNCFDLIGT